MQELKKLTAVVTAMATMAGALPPAPAFAQQARVIPINAAPTAPADQATVLSTIQAFPNGGEPLKLAISDLMVKHRDLARSLVTILRTDSSLTPAQKQATIAGAADALNRLGIVAADMPVKALPAAAPPEEFAWWIFLLLAAAGAGIGCAIACNTGGGPGPSPN